MKHGENNDEKFLSILITLGCVNVSDNEHPNRYFEPPVASIPAGSFMAKNHATEGKYKVFSWKESAIISGHKLIYYEQADFLFSDAHLYDFQAVVNSRWLNCRMLAQILEVILIL